MVNVVASFVLGLVVGTSPASGLATLLGTGFCGALSTYSTFSYETLRLAEENAWLPAAANVMGSVVAGLAAAAVGWALGQAVL